VTDYCNASSVEAWFPGVVFSADTKVTATRVAALIARHSAYIDSRLDAVYTVPITGTNALLIVGEICELLTAADVEVVLKSGLGRQSDEEFIDLRQLAEDKIKKIEEGEISLTDAATKTENDFYNYNEENDIDPIIKRDSEQW